MSIFEQISSATGEKSSNQEIVRQCLENPPLLHTIAEGLRTGTPPAQKDCAQILLSIGKVRPDLLVSFVGDFVETAKAQPKPLARLGFDGLTTMVRYAPQAVFAERNYLMEVAKQDSPLALRAATVLAELCAHSTNYRGKLVAGLVRLVVTASDKDLARWLKALSPAFAGSPDAVKRLTREFEPRRETLSATTRAKADKIFQRLEKTVQRRSR